MSGVWLGWAGLCRGFGSAWLGSRPACPRLAAGLAAAWLVFDLFLACDLKGRSGGGGEDILNFQEGFFVLFIFRYFLFFLYSGLPRGRLGRGSRPAWPRGGLFLACFWLVT